MNLYILWTDYENIDGIFSSREKAEAARDKHYAARTYGPKSLDDYSITEVTLDASESDS